MYNIFRGDTMARYTIYYSTKPHIKEYEDYYSDIEKFVK